MMKCDKKETRNVAKARDEITRKPGTKYHERQGRNITKAREEM